MEEMRGKVKSLTSAIVSKNISEEISLASALKLLHSIIHWDMNTVTAITFSIT